MATRPATGSLKMPVTTFRPFQTTALGRPTLTDSTCSVDDGCMLLLLLTNTQFSLHLVFEVRFDAGRREVSAKTDRLSSQRVVVNNIHTYVDLEVHINHTIEKCTCQYPVSVV